MSTRQELSDWIRDALREHDDLPDREKASECAERVVRAVVATAGYGWLIMDGQVRRVQVADRFGPESWEITTERTPGDLDDWNDPRRGRK